MSGDIVERLFAEMAADAAVIMAKNAEIERLRKRLQACQSTDVSPLTDDCITQNERFLLAENERLRALVADYENGIDWHTTCTNCATLMDGNYEQYCEIERLRAAFTAIQSEANIAGDGGCACSDVYVQTLNRVWKMAHDALPVVGGPS